MAEFKNKNGENEVSKTTGYMLIHPVTDSVLGYLNIPNYLDTSVVEALINAQTNLGFIVRKSTDERAPTNVDMSFLS